MADTMNVVCTVCPLSCEVVLTAVDGKVTGVEGNRCKRGQQYAEKEYTNPERTLTTTVRIRNGFHPLLPVRTDRPIAKHLLLQAMAHTRCLVVDSPIKMGDVVCQDIAGSGASLVASRDMQSEE